MSIMTCSAIFMEMSRSFLGRQDTAVFYTNALQDSHVQGMETSLTIHYDSTGFAALKLALRERDAAAPSKVIILARHVR
jgi:hypothetical protein|tara:strand:+ start:24256 stop:24492 length:237 start_codon:yes stop_codon:yes gene_type:complete